MPITSKKTRKKKIDDTVTKAQKGQKAGEGFKRGLKKFGRKPATTKAEQIIMKHKDAKFAAAQKKKKAKAKKKKS